MPGRFIDRQEKQKPRGAADSPTFGPGTPWVISLFLSRSTLDSRESSNLAFLFTSPIELQTELNNPRLIGLATYDSKAYRVVHISIGTAPIGTVECIEELGSEL